MYFSSIQKFDSSYMIIGGTRDVNGVNFTRILIADLDGNGSFVSYRTIGDSLAKSFGAFYNALYYDESKYLFYAGYTVDTAANLLVIKRNLQSDSIAIYEYNTPDSYSFQGYRIQKVLDDYYVCGVHNFKPGFNSNIVLLRIDSTGNILWQKYYDQKAMDYARSIVQLSNGNIMLGAVRNDLNQTNEKANTWLLEVDTGGNVVRQWFDPSDSTYVAEGLRQTQDGGFIYGAQKKNYQSGFSPVSYNATIVKMDSNFNKQWTFTRGGNDLSIYTAITDIEELSDGSFIAAGHLTYYGSDTALNGYVVKLDVNGNVIWERNYRGINASQTLNFLSDIDILPDGGLIAVGQCQKRGATPPQVGWFLKLDSNGCEIENCTVGFEEMPTQKQIQVYPNPTKNSFKVALPDDMHGAVIAVYDVTGVLALKTTANSNEAMVDVQGLSKGLYMVVAEKQGKVARGKLVIE